MSFRVSSYTRRQRAGYERGRISRPQHPRSPRRTRPAGGSS